MKTMWVIEMREPGKPSGYILSTHGQWFASKKAAEVYVQNMHPSMHVDGRTFVIKEVSVGKRNACEIKA